MYIYILLHIYYYKYIIKYIYIYIYIYIVKIQPSFKYSEFHVKLLYNLQLENYSLN